LVTFCVATVFYSKLLKKRRDRSDKKMRKKT
jgi:hypothetical protein